MDRYNIINYLIRKYGLKSYLEIGMNDPNGNYLKIECEHKESCDPYEEDVFDSLGEDMYRYVIENGILTYRMTSDEMFYEMDGCRMYDIIFIDGLHTEEQVDRDIRNSVQHLSPGGFILVHDTLPDREGRQLEYHDPYYGHPVLYDNAWNGSVWKSIPKLYDAGARYHTVDIPNGITIIQYDRNPEKFPEFEPADYGWDDVFAHKAVRDAAMRCISCDEFFEKY